MAERGGGEAGSVLLLVPAGILIIFVLGALAVDVAVVGHAHRELAGAVAAAANDAAAAGLDDASFYRDGRMTVDPARADTLARQAVAARLGRGVESVVVTVTTAGRQVCVAARATVPYVFAPAIPGARTSTVVTARSTATATEEGEPTVERRALC